MDDIVKGFDKERSEYAFPVVKSVDRHGASMYWQVRVEFQTRLGEAFDISKGQLTPPMRQIPNLRGVITTRSGRDLSAASESAPTFVLQGKNIGKKNETNAAYQALRDANGLYNKKASRGGQHTFLPMLVQKLNGLARKRLAQEMSDLGGVMVQRKYNGVRMVAMSEAGGVVMYSRTGTPFHGLSEIRQELLGLLAGQPSVYLDGELYKHGLPLQELSGLVRRRGAEPDLKYCIFDCFWPDRPVPASDRQQFLDRLFAGYAGARLERVETFEAKSLEELEKYYQQFLREKYEGAIIRKKGGQYEYGNHNYHSSTVLKQKPIYDDEFKVVGFTCGKRGKDAKAVIWICATKAGLRFNVVPKNMTIDERKHIFRFLNERLGKTQTRFQRDFAGLALTVEYPDLTVGGVPAQAKALSFRTADRDLPDPLQRLFADHPYNNPSRP